MALNPFFLQGSPSEQRLIQELINEQLKIYGIEVIYLPRKIVNRKTIIEEVQSSKYDDSFALEAYVNTYEGYSGSGDLMTKFGVSLKDDLTLTISQERFEDFISPFLASESADEIILASRPREGDLIYFPLGQRLFEVKFVEHEKPFYQLGNTYVYELQCELFEYQDEIIDTSINVVDEVVKDKGYIVDLKLVSAGTTATATASIGSGFIKSLVLNNDGYGYTTTPTVAISTAPSGGVNATAVAITTCVAGLHSIDRILLTNAGAGYTEAPTITISGVGTGAKASCLIGIGETGVVSFNITNGGTKYTITPTVTITGGGGSNASGQAVVGSGGTISNIYVTNPGTGYTEAPTVEIGTGSTVGSGSFWLNEVITGSISSTTAKVKNWDASTGILQISNLSGTFHPGEVVTGYKSGAKYHTIVSSANTTTDKYRQNEQIETESDLILDFTESNPFGVYTC
jgi:hypothetical protein